MKVLLMESILPMTFVNPTRREVSSHYLFKFIIINMTEDPLLTKWDFRRSSDNNNKKKIRKPKFESIIQCLKNKGLLYCCYKILLLIDHKLDNDN